MNTGTRGCALTAWAALCVALGITACASAPPMGEAPSATAGEAPGGVIGLLSSVADKALEATGIKAPSRPTEALPDSALPDRRIRWQLHASGSLNTTERGQSLGLVTRIFRLRNPDSFLQAQMDTFGDPVREKQALGDDLVSVREVQLVPGQHHEAIDKVARDIPYIGIVALYRQPAPGRWRYAFKAADVELGGLSLGAHACALSVQQGAPIGWSAAHVRSVAIACP